MTAYQRLTNDINASLLKQARADLMLEMQELAETAGEPVDWSNDQQPKYYICPGVCGDDLYIQQAHIPNVFEVYFPSKQLAQIAMEQYGERIRYVMRMREG